MRCDEMSFLKFFNYTSRLTSVDQRLKQLKEPIPRLLILIPSQLAEFSMFQLALVDQ